MSDLCIVLAEELSLFTAAVNDGGAGLHSILATTCEMRSRLLGVSITVKFGDGSGITGFSGAF